MWVFREQDVLVKTCECGGQHQFSVCLVKELFETTEVRSIFNGYGKIDEKVYVDRQGNSYCTRSPIDFHSGSRYVRDDGWVFQDAFHMPKNAVDLFGHPLHPVRFKGDRPW